MLPCHWQTAVVASSGGEVVLLPALVASAAEVITVVRVEW